MAEHFYSWKKDLNNEIKLIRIQITESEKFSSILAYDIEKFTFLSAFIIRKLIEENQISEASSEESILCKYYKRNDVALVLSREDLDRFEDFYDLNKFKEIRLKPKDLSNILIHSFAFQIRYGKTYSKDNLKIYVNSKRTVGEVYEIEFLALLRFMQRICHVRK